MYCSSKFVLHLILFALVIISRNCEAQNSGKNNSTVTPVPTNSTKPSPAAATAQISQKLNATQKSSFIQTVPETKLISGFSGTDSERSLIFLNETKLEAATSALESDGDEGDVRIDDEVFRSKLPGQNPPKIKPTPTTPPITDEDKRVRTEWGGNCKHQNWLDCNNIKTYLGDYIVKDKKDPNNRDKWIINNRIINCEKEKSLCLRNGWTATRCHLLCMSKCNRDILQSWDKFVSYEGNCRFSTG